MKKTKDKIIIYTQRGCVYCLNVKEQFDKANISYIEKYIEEEKEDWMEITRLTGMPTTPTVVYKNEYMVPGRDFKNPHHLISYIENFKTPKFSTTKQMEQRLRTLTYNISMAFGRTDQILREIETQLKDKENDDEAKTT